MQNYKVHTYVISMEFSHSDRERSKTAVFAGHFFSPSENFRLLVCSKVSEVTAKMLNASQIYFGFLFLKEFNTLMN